MLIQNILEKEKNNLQFLNKTNENVELIGRTITEFKKHNVNVDLLAQKTEEIENEYLKVKLNDIKKIYEKYQDSISKNYIDEEDILTILHSKIEQSNMFDESLIYIDEFSGFTTQEYLIVEELLKKAKQVNVVICTDTIDTNSQMETDIFYSSKQVIKKLENVVKNSNTKLEEPVKLESKVRFKNKELEHIENNIYSIPYKKYEEEVKNIYINLETNPYQETENIAKEIINLVRENDIKYRDISIITKNIEEYANLVKVIFKKYEIPIFIDKKEDLSKNILVKYILSILEIFSKNWSYDSVFSYLKTDFLDIEKNDIYKLQNYSKKWGIRGSKWYKEDWKYDELTIDLEHLNDLRKKVTEPLLELKNSLSKSKTATDITKSLYNFLEKNNVKQKLQQKVNKLKEEDIEIAKEYKASWQILIKLLDEIVLIFKDNKMSFLEYKNILKTGLDFSEFGELPQVIDQVILGDVERSRTHKVKVVFIIGVNDGVFPKVTNSEGFLNDLDREILKENGLELAKGSIENIYEDEFNIYKAFSMAEEKVYLSYVSTDKEGKAKRASILISKIKKMFPKLKEQSNVLNQKFNISIANTTFNEMLSNIRKLKNGEKIDERWIQVYNWYIENKEWKSKTLKVIKAFEEKNRAEKLSSENITRLYGSTLKTSISRLEQYRRCPFSFYLKYGLKLKEKEELQIKSIDTGTFMHDVIDTFFKKVEDIKTLEEDEIESIVEEIINEKLNLSKNYIFTSTPKFVVLTNRLKKVVLQAIKYIVYQLINSDFKTIANEVEFIRKIGNVEVMGKIDRIDEATGSEGKFIRIIDYKSSSKNIDFNEVFAGTQIQLLTYLDTAVENKKGMPAGMLYFNLIDTVVKAKNNLNEEEIKEELKKQFRMNGIILADVNVVKMMDKKLEKGASSIVPAYIDLEGNLSASKSSIVTKEQFTKLQQVIKKVIKQIGDEILSGNIEIKPTYSKKTKTEACKYCQYKSICNFNPNANNYLFIENKPKEEFLKEENL